MNTNSSISIAHTWLQRVPASPDAYPQKLDLVRASILGIHFSEADYRAASFLDDRILGPSTQGAWLAIERVVAAAQLVHEPRPLHFILHTGHVGSTLVSRLLDTSGAVLSLREPLPLRTLAEASDSLGLDESLLSERQFEQLLDTFARLWCRGYATTRCVVVKATSATARLAPWLMRRHPSSRACYLTVRAEPYLATLLAGANSAADLRGHGAERMRRLRRSVGAPMPPLHALSPGELTALSWLAESITRRAVMTQFNDRLLPLDFDEILEDVPSAMARVAAHFDLPSDAGWVTKAASAPELTRYSKSPVHAYSPALRAQILQQARTEHRTEIAKGLRWLEQLAEKESLVADVLRTNA